MQPKKDKGTKVTFVRGVLNSPTDKRFANSAPCYMGITRKILAGFKGVHPNA